MTGSLPAYISGLLDPSRYPHPAGSVDLVQTHISYILLAGAYAYKIKKPLDLGFLDYSTLDRRRRMCEEEVRLNRRLCEGVYLGVLPVTQSVEGEFRLGGAGEAIEYAVQMRRVPEERTMPRLLASGALSAAHLKALAGRIASFHRHTARGAGIAPFGRVPAVRANWDENFEQTAPYVGRTLSAGQLESVRAYVSRFLAEQGALIDERADAGLVRDCHGDLRADSVVFAPDGAICVMDCIEFSDRIRCGDIASDVAFLAMDLEFRGHRRESDEFVSLYLEALGGDETLPVVLNFYRTYRAFVRGKVDSIQTDEGEVPAPQRADAADRARRYFGLAETYGARPSPPAVVMMVGLSGTGKSFVARALAGRAAAVLLSTDTIRREGADPDRLGPAVFATAAYTPEQRDRVYADMIERARRHLALGRSVVLDATFLARRHRELVARLATLLGLRLFVVQVNAPEDVVRDRLAARGPGISSDARWDTYVAQRQRFDPLDDVPPALLLTLDSTRRLDVLVDEVLDRLSPRPA